eukprot:TRINITY_DN40797_c0_g1_i2.p1 TRINITY_DN40797_c0_g1~~TRINITY_DN40797_c0_g1_i2.p1  ORF type:complete len:227 (-),score=34.90 TRINITY_DN40797_c0_g1_i2:120-800(-)
MYNKVQPLAGEPLYALYDNQVSIHGQYARMGLKEAGCEYITKDIDLPLGQLIPELARLNPKMSIPFFVINDGVTQRVLTDSRDIAMHATTLPGGDKLIPAGKADAVTAVLDKIYSANGGFLAFKSYQSIYNIFQGGLAVVKVVRHRTLTKYMNDPANADLANIYKEKLEAAAKPEEDLEVQVAKANDVAKFLDQTLQANGDAWLTGRFWCVYVFDSDLLRLSFDAP